MLLRRRVHLWKERCGPSDCDINIPGTKQMLFVNSVRMEDTPESYKVGEGAQVLCD